MNTFTPNKPPSKRRRIDENAPPLTPTSFPEPSNPIPDFCTPSAEIHRLRAPLSERTQYQGGYAVTKAAMPSYKAYALNSVGHKCQQAVGVTSNKKLKALKPSSPAAWNKLALESGLIRRGQELREFQVEAANVIIECQKDMCVIALTGAGKSLLWQLPLLVQSTGISLVVIPFTSLGYQGEERHCNTIFSCHFIHSGNHSLQMFETIAQAKGKHIVYACPEMLESPTTAPLLHSDMFKSNLSAIYIDKALCLHESTSWRPAYKNLHLLRKVTGTSAPLITISATLPKLYRDSLETFTSLHLDYHLINLSSYRPELSTVIQPMRHSINSFLDLGFVLPLDATPQTLPYTIVYCDNVNQITEMFWWFYERLLSLWLSTSLVDMLHAGLSEEHQKLVINEFTGGTIHILIATEKVGAGMDFPHITQVVQYRCRRLTLVRWEQRRGRGARHHGMTATGYILVEPSMTGEEEGSPTIKNPRGEDLGLMELLQRKQCSITCSDKWLRNPSRNPTPCTNCSHCFPTLSLGTQYNFLVVDPTAQNTSMPRATIPAQESVKILDLLCAWRLNEWKENWEKKWPCYGPNLLISDEGLEQVSRRAANINTIDELDMSAPILHLDEIGPSLIAAIKTAVSLVCPKCAREPEDNTSQPSQHTQLPTPSQLTWQAPANPETMATKEKEAQTSEQESMGISTHGESIWRIVHPL